MSAVPPGITQPPTTGASTSSSEFDEGLAIFITFTILFMLSTSNTTATFALWVAIAICALVWNTAIQPGPGGAPSPAKTFWQALSR